MRGRAPRRKCRKSKSVARFKNKAHAARSQGRDSNINSNQALVYFLLILFVCCCVVAYYFNNQCEEEVPENIDGTEVKNGMNMNGFDPIEWRFFYFARMSREKAHKVLGEPDVAIGTFLIRDSVRPREYWLSVREADEGNTVYHYLIERDAKEDGTSGVKIANQSFPDIPALLNHFKMHVLTEASLLSAYERKPIIEVVTGVFEFTGELETELSFERGERLEILAKPDDDWWEARNSLGATGLIPAYFVTKETRRKMKGYDPFEWRSFYFARVSREKAHKVLGEPDVSIGTFLIRDSVRPREYWLSVREADEGNTVYHYLIERDAKEDETSGVKIANQSFPDITALLNHFKMHVLTEASLISAYKKPIFEFVIGIFKFTGELEAELSFNRGERLEILAKPNNDWWEARNALGTTGLIPAYFVTTERIWN